MRRTQPPATGGVAVALAVTGFLHWYQLIEREGTGTPFAEVSVRLMAVPFSAMELRIGTPMKFGFSRTTVEVPDQTS